MIDLESSINEKCEGMDIGSKALYGVRNDTEGIPKMILIYEMSDCIRENTDENAAKIKDLLFSLE